MEPYINLFLARPVWIILGFVVVMGLGYFFTKNDPISYSWENKNTSWPEYVLGLAAIIYSIILIFKWGFFPFLYWFGVMNVALLAGIMTYGGIALCFFTEEVPRGDKDDWMDPIRTRDKDMDCVEKILITCVGLVVFFIINLIGIHWAL